MSFMHFEWAALSRIFVAENSDVWRRLAEAYLLQGDGQQSMAAAVRAIQLDPLSSGAVLVLARALTQVLSFFWQILLLNYHP